MGVSPDGLPFPALLESLLFVSPEPVRIAQLAAVLGCTVEAVEEGLAALAAALDGRGICLVRQGDAVALRTVPAAAPYIERLRGLAAPPRLSAPALETLAIIAYRQPITRAQIEAIRGVNVDHVLQTLEARGLITVVGQAEAPGRPALFGTTPAFLEAFGLRSLADLPPLPADQSVL